MANVDHIGTPRGQEDFSGTARPKFTNRRMEDTDVPV